MRHLLIRNLTEEQVAMFMALAGLRLLELYQGNAQIDLGILLAPDNIVLAELDPNFDTEQRDPVS